MRKRVLLVKTDAQMGQRAERILYLGSWCRGGHEGSVDADVLPHHLDDINRVDEWVHKADKIYDYYLHQLSFRLNTIHKKNWSLRAWSILIGPWLQVFLDVVIDRFETIRQLAHCSEDVHTRLTQFPENSFAFSNTADFNWAAATSDEFNEYIFSKILLRIPEEKILITGTDNREKVTTSPIKKSDTFRQKIVKMASRLVAELPRRITFVDSYFKCADRFLLEIWMKQLPFMPPVEEACLPVCADSVTRKLTIPEPYSSDILHQIICDLIPELLPSNYLENYEKLLAEANISYPKKTQVIVTAHFYSYNESFRIWAASQVDQGVRLAAIQHGGGYGVGLRWSPLLHELNVADVYFTSGWRSDNFSLTIPMPVPKLVNARKRFSATPDGGILWVWKALRMYSLRIAEGSVNHDVAEYLDEQVRFGAGLSREIKTQTILRLYDFESAWNEKQLVSEKLPDIKIDQGKFPYQVAAKDKKLWVITYNSTTLLEALVANIPFVAFWNTKHCVNRLAAEAVPLFEELRMCGVFHDSPESAAEAANEYFPCALTWWEQRNIQRIREEFCKKYAVTSPNWLNVWRQQLEKEASF